MCCCRRQSQNVDPPLPFALLDLPICLFISLLQFVSPMDIYHLRLTSRFLNLLIIANRKHLPKWPMLLVATNIADADNGIGRHGCYSQSLRYRC
jgi:hypothetical protein